MLRQVQHFMGVLSVLYACNISRVCFGHLAATFQHYCRDYTKNLKYWLPYCLLVF